MARRLPREPPKLVGIFSALLQYAQLANDLDLRSPQTPSSRIMKRIRRDSVYHSLIHVITLASIDEKRTRVYRKNMSESAPTPRHPIPTITTPQLRGPRQISTRFDCFQNKMPGRWIRLLNTGASRLFTDLDVHWSASTETRSKPV